MKSINTLRKKICILLVSTTSVFMVGCSSNQDTTNSVMNIENSLNNTTDISSISTNDITPASKDIKSEPSIAPSNKEKIKLQKSLEKKYNLTFLGDVPNDCTGNWRFSTYSSDKSPETFVIDYYNAFFESDNEIHGLINSSSKTSSSISLILDNILDVTVHEYIDGEEFDAKIMFSGPTIKEYWVYLDTGTIEDITEE